MPLRFNHMELMELTVPRGTFARERDNLTRVYKEIFDFDAMDVPLFEPTGLLLATEPQVSQFILLMEQEVNNWGQTPFILNNWGQTPFISGTGPCGKGQRRDEAGITPPSVRPRFPASACR